MKMTARPLDCVRSETSICMLPVLESYFCRCWRFLKTISMKRVFHAHNISVMPSVLMPSLFWRCFLAPGRASGRPVKIERWGVGVVFCLERGADCLHMVQLMPLPSQNPVISCRILMQTAFTFLIIFISPRMVAHNIIVLQKKNNLTKRNKHRKVNQTWLLHF